MRARHFWLINIVWVWVQGWERLSRGNSDTSGYRHPANVQKVVCGRNPANPMKTQANPATFRAGIYAKAAAKSQDLWPLAVTPQAHTYTHTHMHHCVRMCSVMTNTLRNRRIKDLKEAQAQKGCSSLGTKTRQPRPRAKSKQKRDQTPVICNHVYVYECVTTSSPKKPQPSQKPAPKPYQGRTAQS